VAILRRHLIEKVPVSDLCEEVQIAPTMFYRWQQQLFENGAAAFGKQREVAPEPWKERAEALASKLQRKNEVLSELMEEHLQLKKGFGEV
jgi:transposase-like protein